MVKGKKKNTALWILLTIFTVMNILMLVTLGTSAWFTDSKNLNGHAEFGSIALETKTFTLPTNQVVMPNAVLLESSQSIQYKGSLPAYYRIKFDLAFYTKRSGTNPNFEYIESDRVNLESMPTIPTIYCDINTPVKENENIVITDSTHTINLPENLNLQLVDKFLKVTMTIDVIQTEGWTARDIDKIFIEYDEKKGVK